MCECCVFSIVLDIHHYIHREHKLRKNRIELQKCAVGNDPIDLFK